MTKKKRGNPKIREVGARTRFKPGVSPNPGGRPKCCSFSEAIRAVAGLTVKELRNSPTDSVATGVAKALARAALRGKVSAVSEVIDRAEGKARQSVDLLHKEPVQIRVVYEDPLELPQHQNQRPAKPTEDSTDLFQRLLEIVQTTPDEKVMKAASALALLIKKPPMKGRDDAISA